MWTLGIVFCSIQVRFLLCIDDGEKERLIEKLISTFSVKRFNERILLRLTWFDKAQSDAMPCRPFMNIFAPKFWTVIDSYVPGGIPETLLSDPVFQSPSFP